MKQRTRTMLVLSIGAAVVAAGAFLGGCAAGAGDTGRNAAATIEAAARDSATIILVRHAHKEQAPANRNDPGLSGEGVAQAAGKVTIARRNASPNWRIERMPRLERASLNTTARFCSMGDNVVFGDSAAKPALLATTPNASTKPRVRARPWEGIKWGMFNVHLLVLCN